MTSREKNRSAFDARLPEVTQIYYIDYGSNERYARIKY